jgi:uncharacterized protein (DUF885 family)
MNEDEPVVPLVKDYEALKARLDKPQTKGEVKPARTKEVKPERGMLHDFIGKHVVLHMRNDLAISCEIRGESRYELLIRAVDEMDAIVLKHAIDFIELDLDDG